MGDSIGDSLGEGVEGDSLGEGVEGVPAKVSKAKLGFRESLILKANGLEDIVDCAGVVEGVLGEEENCSTGGGDSGGAINEKAQVIGELFDEEGLRVSCGAFVNVNQGKDLFLAGGYGKPSLGFRASSYSIDDQVSSGVCRVGSVSGTKTVILPCGTMCEGFGSDVFFRFSNFGIVVDSFIPRKRSKIDGSRFGFVRFSEEIDALRACDVLDGSMCEGFKVIVNVSRFARSPKLCNFAGKFVGASNFPPAYSHSITNKGSVGISYAKASKFEFGLVGKFSGHESTEDVVDVVEDVGLSAGNSSVKLKLSSCEPLEYVFKSSEQISAVSNFSVSEFAGCSDIYNMQRFPQYNSMAAIDPIADS